MVNSPRKVVRFKTNLQYLRFMKGITQAELASNAGVNIRTLQDYEQGHKSINGARTVTVSRIAQALGCSIEDILETGEAELRSETSATSM